MYSNYNDIWGRTVGTPQDGAQITGINYKMGNGSVKMDGSSDAVTYVCNASLVLGPEYTYRLWFNASTQVATSLGGVLLIRSNAGDTVISEIRIALTTNVIFFQTVYNGVAKSVTSTSRVDDNRYHHLVATVNASGNMTMYIDGNVNGSITGVGGGSASTINTGTFTLGYMPSDTGRAYKGHMSDVLILNRSWTFAEVRQDWNNGDGWNWEGNSSTVADTTPPIITITGLNTTYNDTYNRLTHFNVSLNEAGNCSVNNSLWILTGNTSTLFYFNDTGAPDSFYELKVNCSDKSQNSNLAYVRFWKDFTMPSVTTSIINLSATVNIGTIDFNFTCSDNLLLYNFRGNISESGAGGNEKWNFSLTALTKAYYSNLTTLNTATWTNTSYYFQMTCCDAHTATELTPPKITVTTDTLGFKFPDAQINIKSLTGLETLAYSNCLTDRCDFNFEYSEKTGIKTYSLTSDKPIVYLKDSPFSGHFIMGGGNYWVDFEPVTGLQIEKISDLEYTISSWAIPDEKVRFNSVGALNCRDYSVTFNLTKTPPDTLYSKDYIKGTQWFNTDIMDLSTVPGVLILFLIVFMYFGLLFLAWFSRIPALHLLPLVYGVMVGLLLASLLSTALGIMVVAGSAIVAIAGTMVYTK